MALVYFDASALVKLCVAEPGSELASALWNRADVVSTSRLSDTEVRAALAAGERAGVLDAAERAQALATWERLWPALHLVEVSPEVLDRASALAGGNGHSLRGADAVHQRRGQVDGVGPAQRVAVGTREGARTVQDPRGDLDQVQRGPQQVPRRERLGPLGRVEDPRPLPLSLIHI